MARKNLAFGRKTSSLQNSGLKQFVGMLADCEQSDAVCWYVVVEEVEYLQCLNM